MSTTLKLVDRLLARGRHFQALGCDSDALHLLGRLAAFRELPTEVAEETQARLAEIQLRHNRPRKARRHLTAALRHQPGSARYHLLMARAVDADRQADPERALEHYQRALEVDPNQPECLSECGLLGVRLGQSEEGLRNLRRAVELGPDDPRMVQRLAKGLCLLRRGEEARLALLAALVRHPRDVRFRKLWDDFRFDQLRLHQEAMRLAQQGDDAADAASRILPFVRPVRAARPGGATPLIIRRDDASSTPPPHLTRPARLPRHRHAQ